ncbi:MAG: TetR/AcrR family transcriptional regulator [Conexibacter sp.]|nr:TetR/AcrR family transcriptional regulator [Conexibacter sp.]
MFPCVLPEQPPKKRQREAYQLPAGRHGLSRQFVVSNQRERILAAVADVCSAAGYVAMSVEDIVVTSGVSRRTFYDNFRGKEDVYLAAYDEVTQQLLTQVYAAYEGADGLVAKVRDSLSAFLNFVADEPAFADMCIVEVMAAGSTAIERRNRTMAAFAEMIGQAAAAELPKTKLPPALTAETLVGGIYEVVYSRVLQGRGEELPALLPDLLFSVLLPYVGRETASSLLKNERRRSKPKAGKQADAG